MEFCVMRVRIKKIPLLVLLLALLIRVFLDQKGIWINDFYCRFAAVLVLVLTLVLVWKSRIYPGLFIINMFVLWFNYSIVIERYLIREPWELYDQFVTLRVHQLGIDCLLLFVACVIFFFPAVHVRQGKKHVNLETEYNSLLAGLLAAAIVVVILNRFWWHIIPGELQLYEYAVIFFILGLYYCGTNKFLRALYFVLGVVHCLSTMMIGGRVDAMQILLVLYVFFFFRYYTAKRIVVLMVLGVIFLSIVGVYDDIYDQIVIGDTGALLDVLGTAFSNLRSRWLAIDTAYFAWLSSMSFIAYGDMVSWLERGKDLAWYLISQVLGGGVYHAKLCAVTREYFVHYNGGIFPIYFFYYLGTIGVAFSGWIIARFYGFVSKLELPSQKKFSKILGIYVIATMPRWYVYEPTSLLRGVLFLAICYFACSVVHRYRIRISL